MMELLLSKEPIAFYCIITNKTKKAVVYKIRQDIY